MTTTHRSSRAPSGLPVLRIDMRALKSNYRALETKIGKRAGKPVSIGACVKADAYGIGMRAAAQAFYGLGCRVFFVANAIEGRSLREMVGKQPSIYVFNGPSAAEISLFFEHRLKPVLNSMAQTRLWIKALSEADYKPRCALHLDTGMNRLGFSLEEFTQLASDKALLSELDVEIFMSHLACAPDAHNPANKTQLTAFKKAAAALPAVTLSLANSAGIYLGSDYHFHLVRPGAALYGLQATTNPAQEVTKAVVTLSAPILQQRKVPKGTGLGYNGTAITRRPSRIFTLGLGYADGISVTMSNKGYATIKGQKLPIIGRVSMDLTLVDATDYEGDLTEGLHAEFFGDQLETQCELIGGLNYELLTGLGRRFRRHYIK